MLTCFGPTTPTRARRPSDASIDPKLTANIYTDAALLDLQGAVDALPLAGEERTMTRTKRPAIAG
jgi:hypothetical protein